ncbi:MAG: hypothetical protein MUF31_13400 [Akkermansiaceae bacterium]|jgi:hypothetical protein|nr:hypothetical protein [Akkermansiaceae bacterium]
MNLTRGSAIAAVLFPMFAQASVTAVWSSGDAAAAASWLSGIGSSTSRQDPASFFYFSTSSGETLSGAIIANLTVWSDRAELNILGVGFLPSNLQLWGSFPTLGTIMEVRQNELVSSAPGSGTSYFSYTSNFPVESSFSRVAFNSAASDGLLLLADSGGSTNDVYTFRLTPIPEPGVALLGALGSIFSLRRRRNNKANNKRTSSNGGERSSYNSSFHTRRG